MAKRGAQSFSPGGRSGRIGEVTADGGGETLVEIGEVGPIADRHPEHAVREGAAHCWVVSESCREHGLADTALAEQPVTLGGRESRAPRSWAEHRVTDAIERRGARLVVRREGRDAEQLAGPLARRQGLHALDSRRDDACCGPAIGAVRSLRQPVGQVS
ncbi:MAG: hypothetical protein R2715_21885 [Ilumatobacteraceae bacterium]